MPGLQSPCRELSEAFGAFEFVTRQQGLAVPCSAEKAQSRSGAALIAFILPHGYGSGQARDSCHTATAADQARDLSGDSMASFKRVPRRALTVPAPLSATRW